METYPMCAKPYIPVPGVIQVEMIQNWAGQVIENVHHFVVEPAPTVSLMNDLASGMVGAWNTGMKPSMPLNLSLTSVRLTDLTTQTGPVVNYGLGLPSAGTYGNPSLPNNCACVITKRTAQRGRSYRGRSFLPGLTEPSVADNVILPALLTTFLSYFANIRQPTYSGTQFVMVVVSRYTNNLPRAVGVATTVTGFTADQVVDSQRGRLPGRGS